jgi:hypothetical protein
MSQVSAVLDRVDEMAHRAWALHVSAPVAYQRSVDDDDLIDEWLASLSVDEFEGFLSGLAELR